MYIYLPALPAKGAHNMRATPTLTASGCDSPVAVHVLQLSASVDEALYRVTGGIGGSGAGDGQCVPATRLQPPGRLDTTHLPQTAAAAEQHQLHVQDDTVVTFQLYMPHQPRSEYFTCITRVRWFQFDVLYTCE